MKLLQARFGQLRYPVALGKGVIRQLPHFLNSLSADQCLTIVTDPTVRRLHGQLLSEILRRHHIQTEMLVIRSGEQHKNLHTIEYLCNRFHQISLNRNSLLLAFGGGMVGDIAGLAAALYHRGMRYIHIPTTLIAMADSAIGGKTGVNLPDGKNQIGCFHPPAAVIADTLFLHTLSRRDILSGFGEVVKYGIAAHRSLFRYLRQQDQAILNLRPAVLQEVLWQCIKIKNQIVCADPLDHCQRRILNFGHTFAHALESLSDYRLFRHGEAVLLGMLMATELSVITARLNPSAAAPISQLLLKHIPAVVAQRGIKKWLNQLDVDLMIEQMKSDKKNIKGNTAFTLLTDIGKAQINCRVSTDSIRSAIEQALNRIQAGRST